MKGLYLHIPFCRQACHYCDFHFSTSLKKREAMVEGLRKELLLRKEEIDPSLPVDTIYFGGGTPSVLLPKEIESILNTIREHYSVADHPEITLEANPDDLSIAYMQELKAVGINRLSIGVQSFFDRDLTLMNRSHNSTQALQTLEEARRLFDNISADLIYGIPGLEMEQWQSNIQTLLKLDIPHISSYALTVEPKTALAHFVEKEVIPAPSDEAAEAHFLYLTDTLEKNGFVHYEISNFGKPGLFSRNNTAYWQGKPYLGVGPSAHSYDGSTRSWNIRNNPQYLKAISEGILPLEREVLTPTDRYNEYVMTGLRTIWGVSLEVVEREFGENRLLYLLLQAKSYLEEGYLEIIEEGVYGSEKQRRIRTTRKGKFLADGIASHLFLLHLQG